MLLVSIKHNHNFVFNIQYPTKFLTIEKKLSILSILTSGTLGAFFVRRFVFDFSSSVLSVFTLEFSSLSEPSMYDSVADTWSGTRGEFTDDKSPNTTGLWLPVSSFTCDMQLKLIVYR